MAKRNRIGLLLLFPIMMWGSSAIAQGIGGGFSNAGNKPPVNNRGGFNPGANARNPFGNQTDTATTNTPNGIDYSHVEEKEEDQIAAVYLYRMAPMHVKIDTIEHPSLEPDGVSLYDPLDAVAAPFALGVGGFGRPHLFLNPLQQLSTPLYPMMVQQGYSQPVSQVLLFQVRRPFTSLRYGGSLNGDNQFQAIHSQNINPRWNVALDYTLYSRSGVYTRTALKNHYLDVTTSYFSRNNRYQLRSGILYRDYNQEENGGVPDVSHLSSSSSDTRAGVPVALYEASNHWGGVEAFAHQSYNTVRQITEQRLRHIPVALLSDTAAPSDSTALPADSIVVDTLYASPPHILNTGVFALDVDYGRHSRHYADLQPPMGYYPTYYYSTAEVLDSTLSHQLSSRLYWTNDAYLDSLWRNPIKVFVGVKENIYSIDYSLLDSHRWSDLDLFAQSLIALGPTTLQLEGTLVKSSAHTDGDYQIQGLWQWPMAHGRMQIHLSQSQQAPSWYYYQYRSNNYSWDNATLMSPQRRMASLLFCRQWCQSDSLQRAFSTSLLLTALQQQGATWLGADYCPHQTAASATLLQAQLQSQLSLGWFHYQGNHLYQYSTSADHFRVPTFATKNSLYADFTLFHDALRVQTGLDLRYHTRYYADGYLPALSAFYRQDLVSVGNYLWADIFLTLKVKQASIYLRAVHLNALWEDAQHYMQLPHLPGQDFGLHFGVIWRFFD